MAKRGSRFLLGLLAIFSIGVALGQVHTPTPHLQNKLAEAAETTSRVGFHAKLPPHISTLLGLAKDQECPVMQSVMRRDALVQGLDVSMSNKNDIILFIVDESTMGQNLYLTSPSGKLRKVVSVKKGVGDIVVITPRQEKDFQDQKQFWIDRLVPAAKAK